MSDSVRPQPTRLLQPWDSPGKHTWVGCHFLLQSMHACYVASVVSDSVWPHGQQPTRLLCSWNSSGKNIGVGCHFLLQHQTPTDYFTYDNVYVSMLFSQIIPLSSPTESKCFPVKCQVCTGPHQHGRAWSFLLKPHHCPERELKFLPHFLERWLFSLPAMS